MVNGRHDLCVSTTPQRSLQPVLDKGPHQNHINTDCPACPNEMRCTRAPSGAGCVLQFKGPETPELSTTGRTLSNAGKEGSGIR
jgi:hypothetical protein